MQPLLHLDAAFLAFAFAFGVAVAAAGAEERTKTAIACAVGATFCVVGSILTFTP